MNIKEVARRHSYTASWRAFIYTYIELAWLFGVLKGGGGLAGKLSNKPVAEAVLLNGLSGNDLEVTGLYLNCLAVTHEFSSFRKEGQGADRSLVAMKGS